MPFQSEKQRRYLHANHPEIAKRWERDYAGGGRIGYDEGTISPALKKRMLELLLQGMPLDKIKKEAEKQLKQDPYIKERMGIGEGPILEASHDGILDINESEEIISDDGNDIELTAYNAAFDDPNDLSTGVKSLFQAKDGGTPRRRYFTGAYGVGGTENTGGSTNRERGIQQAYSQPAYSPTGDASVAEQIAAGDRQRKQDIKDIIARGDEEKYDTEEQMLQR